MSTNPLYKETISWLKKKKSKYNQPVFFPSLEKKERKNNTKAKK